MEKLKKRMHALFESKFYSRLIEQLKKLKPKEQNVKARKKIRKCLHKVLKIAPHIKPRVDDKTLHKLRIAIKNLRYVCEFFAPLFSLDQMIARTKQIQDILGQHQDAITGMALLKLYGGELPVDKFQKLKKAFERKKKKTRQTFFKIWEKENENS